MDDFHLGVSVSSLSYFFACIVNVHNKYTRYRVWRFGFGIQTSKAHWEDFVLRTLLEAEVHQVTE